MPAKVIDLDQWKASHPPAARCVNAMVKCWMNWSSLIFLLSFQALAINQKRKPKGNEQ